jgi:uncharacterized repeat protein (TIGR03943 family)
MKPEFRMGIHYLLRGLFFGAFSLYTLHLVRTDAISLYIAPKMEIIVKLAAIVFAVVAVYLIYGSLRYFQGNSIYCDCEHHHQKPLWRHTIAYALFLAPLFFGYFVPDTVMGSHLIDKKGISLYSSEAIAEQQPSEGGLFFAQDPYVKQYSQLAQTLFLQETILVEEDKFLEISTAIDLFKKPFQGKTIQIEGFVYVQEGMNNSQFVVARLAMECCSADATPYGFLVEWPEAREFYTDSWVRVIGNIGSTMYEGTDVITIQATAVERIEMPETPYVYPNYDILDNQFEGDAS